MDMPRLTPGPLAGQPLAGLQAGTSLLRHRDGRTGTFAQVEADGRLRVQSLKGGGKGYWIFDPAWCDYDGERDVSPRPNKRQQAKARTIAKVTAAARSLFEAGGYEAATIRDIAAAAGMSTGAIFANFTDKADLWRAVFNGPPPSRELADEMARMLGALPTWNGALSWHPKGGFRVQIVSPDSVFGFTGDGPSPAAALRHAREQAAAHAVRQEAAA